MEVLYGPKGSDMKFRFYLSNILFILDDVELAENFQRNEFENFRTLELKIFLHASEKIPTEICVELEGSISPPGPSISLSFKLHMVAERSPFDSPFLFLLFLFYKYSNIFADIRYP